MYNVEYYDSREAAIAFEDLSDKVMFGMKIGVSRKTGNLQHPGPSTVPFPNTATAGESFVSLAANHATPPQLQHKPQFTDARKVCGTKIYNDQKNLSPQPSPYVIPAGDASSPPFFYASTPPFVEASNNTSILSGDASGSAPNSTQHAHSEGQIWDGDHIHSPAASHCYTPDGTCLYCPSRGPMQYNPGFTRYAMSPSTPSAIYYPAPVNTAYLPNMLNVAPVPNQGAFVYDYADPHQLQSVPSAGPWGFDPAIAAIGPGPNTLIPLVATNIPSTAPFFLRDESIPQVPGQVYQGHIQTPDQYIVQSQLLADNPSRHSAIFPKALANVPTSESSPSTYRGTSSVKYETTTAITNPASSGQNERNQLNIARIEEGLDTRTTVMIKNIPNKMSDTDLTEYIGKVCPRRIDFLYLRMDFKNGKITPFQS